MFKIDLCPEVQFGYKDLVPSRTDADGSSKVFLLASLEHSGQNIGWKMIIRCQFVQGQEDCDLDMCNLVFEILQLSPG